MNKLISMTSLAKSGLWFEVVFVIIMALLAFYVVHKNMPGMSKGLP
jgi:hypothetical protein